MVSKNPLKRVPIDIVKYVEEHGWDELRIVVENVVKIERQKLNLTRLQGSELKNLREAKNEKRIASELMQGIDRELVQGRFFEDFWNWGESMVGVAKLSQNIAWVEVKYEELKKLCRVKL